MCAATPQKNTQELPWNVTKPGLKTWKIQLCGSFVEAPSWITLCAHLLKQTHDLWRWILWALCKSAMQGGASMDWIPKPDWNFKLSYHEGSETAFGGCLMLYTSVVSGYNVADQYTNAWYHTFETAFQLNINTPEDKSFFNGRPHHKLPTPVTRFAQMTFLNLSHLRKSCLTELH